MPSPFPGMNPYLEDGSLWRDVHNRLIVSIANDLGAKLRPKYYAAIATLHLLWLPQHVQIADGPLVGTRR